MAKFEITGELITEKTRELWLQGDYKEAIKFISETVPEMERGHQMDLIDYKMQLVGKGNVDFIEETRQAPSDYPRFDDVMGFAQNSRRVISERLSTDRQKGIEIIEYFDTLDGHYYNGGSWSEDKPFSMTTVWYTLLPEVRYELKDMIPYYMSIWLREREKQLNESFSKKWSNGNAMFEKKLGGWGCITSKSIIASTIGVNREIFTTKKGRETYDRVCDELFIYGDQRDEIYENFRALWYRYSIEFFEKQQNRLKEYYAEDIPERLLKYEKTKACKNVEFAWVSPDGYFYPCYYTQHGSLAYSILNQELKIDCTHINAESILENEGWFKIHVSDADLSTVLFSGTKRRPTKLQLKRLEEYKRYHKINIHGY